MSTIIEVEDNYGDALTIDACANGVEISLLGQEWYIRDPSEALPIADAIYAANDQYVPQPPAGAVRASEIPFNEAILRVAAAHSRECSFRYAKGDGTTIESRTFVPSNVQRVGDHVTFTGYDPDRDDYRAYRSDRIKGEVTVGNRYAA